MSRLWVRLSLMIAGVLFLVFFLQFASIMLSPQGPSPAAQGGPIVQPRDHVEGPGNESRSEIVRRLFDFMLLSAAIGLAGGLLIGRIVSAPITELARVARRVGAGNLDVRVQPRGSLEMVELATTFNQMAADLQRAESARNDLMADVSHELRTPLTVLEGNLRAALDHVYTLDEAEIANLYGQTRHLIRLVNDLRELSLAEAQQLPLQKQPSALSKLVADVMQALEPLAAERSITLRNETADLPELTIDPVRIRQVLFNLLTNALRHTPSGGEVAVSAVVSSAEVRLAVTDNGEGLAPDEIAAAFDRFYRADKSRSRETGGTGLGLAIVKAIAEAHGGRVVARSQGKGCGATFVVILPRT